MLWRSRVAELARHGSPLLRDLLPGASEEVFVLFGDLLATTEAKAYSALVESSDPSARGSLPLVASIADQLGATLALAAYVVEQTTSLASGTLPPRDKRGMERFGPRDGRGMIPRPQNLRSPLTALTRTLVVGLGGIEPPTSALSVLAKGLVRQLV